jgi:hypothetical protein
MKTLTTLVMAAALTACGGGGGSEDNLTPLQRIDAQIDAYCASRGGTLGATGLPKDDPQWPQSINRDDDPSRLTVLHVFCANVGERTVMAFWSDGTRINLE